MHERKEHANSSYTSISSSTGTKRREARGEKREKEKKEKREEEPKEKKEEEKRGNPFTLKSKPSSSFTSPSPSLPLFTHLVSRNEEEKKIRETRGRETRKRRN